MSEAETAQAIEAGREPKPSVKLVGTDGNAYALIGKVRAELRRADASKEHIAAFMSEATSGDYDQLLATCCKFADVT